MDWAGWAIYGLIATALLTLTMTGAQLAGLTRLDLPWVLGAVVADDPDRARIVGFFIHLAIGQAFAFGYLATFSHTGDATWWFGGLLGVLHAAVAMAVLVPLIVGLHPRMASTRAGPRSKATLEPPGPLGLNYGAGTPLVALGAHVVYGIALGALLRAS